MNSRVSNRLIRYIDISRCVLRPQRSAYPCNAVIIQSKCLHGESIPVPPHEEPVRKLLRSEAKQKRLEAKSSSLEHSNSATIARGEWELTVGIEIHAELDTERKLFSTAGTSVNDTPNTNVALCDLGYPGAQPLFQPATLLPALRAAIALGCDVQHKSSFDRKHYFYPDQPSGYQVTQYYEPFAKNGSVVLYPYDGIAPEDGPFVRIDIKQVQMEQDTAKSLIQAGSSAHLDFNRVSHPLIEIITLPVIHHPATAAACVRKIQAILRSVGAVTAGMELGGLRADVNVSVRRARSNDPGNNDAGAFGFMALGQRTEIKNLSSFKAVEDAIIAERDRQIQVLEGGGQIIGETRGWTLGSSETVRLRGKEGEVDYRYMPDPDLGPLLISPALVQKLKDTLPMTPDHTMSALLNSVEHKLSEKDASTLLHIDDGDRLDYYLDVLSQLKSLRETRPQEKGKSRTKPKPQLVGNWVLHELGALMSKSNHEWSPDSLPSLQLAQIIHLLELEKITSKSARHLLGLLFSGDQRTVEEIAAEEKLIMVELGDEVYQEHAQRVLDIHRELAVKTSLSDKGKVNHLVGEMMKQMAKAGMGGAVRPARAKEVMLDALVDLKKSSPFTSAADC